MFRGMLVFAAAAVLVAAPSAAADGGSVTFADPCGDNGAYVSSPLGTTALPTTGRAQRFDLQHVAASSSATGVTVRFDVCAPIGTPDGLGGQRLLSARLASDCFLTIHAAEPVATGSAHHVQVAKTCDKPNATGQCPIDTCTEERFALDLPAEAVTVDGRSLTVTVARAGLTGEAAATFAPGTVWRDLTASAMEGPAFGAFVGDGTRAHGPTGVDYAGDGLSLTLG